MSNSIIKRVTIVNILFFLLLWATPAWATYPIQPLFFGTGALPAAAQFTTLEGISVFNATEINRVVQQGPAGAYTEMQIVVSVAPGTGNSWAFMFRNEAANTALTCTISDSSTSCLIRVNVAVGAAENTCLMVTPTGTPAAAVAYGYVLFRPTTAGNTQWGGTTRGTSVSATVDNYITPIGHVVSDTESNAQIVMPTSGSITALRVEISGIPGAGDSYVFTLRVNGGDDTAMQCTVTAAATTCSDVTGSVAVVAGDLVNVECTPTGSPTARRAWIGITFVPTRAGDWVLARTHDTTLSTNTTQYTSLYGSFTMNSLESLAYQLGYPLNIQNIYVALPSAPGAGTSYGFTLRQNNTSLDPRCTISDTATTCNAERAAQLSLGGLVAVEVAPVNTPTAPTNAMISFLSTTGDLYLDAATLDASGWN